MVIIKKKKNLKKKRNNKADFRDGEDPHSPKMRKGHDGEEQQDKVKDAGGPVKLRGHVCLCSSQSPPHPILPLPPLGSQEQRAGLD